MGKISPQYPNLFVSHSRTKQCHLKFINIYEDMHWFKLFQVNNKLFYFSTGMIQNAKEFVQITKSKTTVHQLTYYSGRDSHLI